MQVQKNSLLYWYNTLLCNLYWLLDNSLFFLSSSSNYSDFHILYVHLTNLLNKRNSYNLWDRGIFVIKIRCYNHYCTMLSPAIVVINTIISIFIIGSHTYVLNKQMQLVFKQWLSVVIFFFQDKSNQWIHELSIFTNLFQNL